MTVSRISEFFGYMAVIEIRVCAFHTVQCTNYACIGDLISPRSSSCCANNGVHRSIGLVGGI